MKIKFLKATLGFLLLFSTTAANAGLIEVEFSAEFDKRESIAGSFVYDDVSFELKIIDFSVDDHNYILQNVGIENYPLRDFFIGDLRSGVGGIARIDNYDFWFVQNNNGQSAFTLVNNDKWFYASDVNTKISNYTAKVPEPSTFAIFALAMIGLASRRLKNKSA